jgi:pyruvate/2-oxoglutarate dehydrogenase complex dihydrolipoamide acyltransferase (E2) component
MTGAGMSDNNHYKTVTFPASRLATIDIGVAAFRKHHIRALFELDVTEARIKIAKLEKSEEKISFNAWLIKCISEAITRYPLIHGVRSGKRKAIVFDDVDVSIMVERELKGEKVPLPFVVRRANRKSSAEISREIEAAKKQNIAGEENYVLGDSKSRLLMKIYYLLPGFLRSLTWRAILKNPKVLKEQMGTVMITSVGMIGELRGWIIPVSVHPLCFAVGSIVKKPGVVNDQIEIRESLYLTALVDHDVIDGAPAVRAMTHLKELVESGYDLG